MFPFETLVAQRPVNLEQLYLWIENHPSHTALFNYFAKKLVIDGYWQVLNLLLPHITSKETYPELMYAACLHDNQEFFEKLLPYFSHPETLFEPLRVAVCQGHIDLVKKLIPLSNPKALHSIALVDALFRKQWATVECLLPYSNVKKVSILLTQELLFASEVKKKKIYKLKSMLKTYMQQGELRENTSLPLNDSSVAQRL